MGVRVAARRSGACQNRAPARRIAQRDLVRPRRRLRLSRRVSALLRIRRREVARARRHARDSRRASRRRPRFRSHQQMGALRPSLRRDRRPRSARRPDPRRAIWLFAGDAVAARRRSPRRLRAGFHHSVLLDPARRKIAWRNGARGSQPPRRLHRAAGGPRHHGDSSRRRCARHRQRPEILSVGDIHAGDDDSDRVAARRLLAVLPPGPCARSIVNRRGADFVRGCGRRMGRGFAVVGKSIYGRWHPARSRIDRLRVRSVSAARLATARTARLPERIHQSRRDFFACSRNLIRPPAR